MADGLVVVRHRHMARFMMVWSSWLDGIAV